MVNSGDPDQTAPYSGPLSATMVELIIASILVFPRLCMAS